MSDKYVADLNCEPVMKYMAQSTLTFNGDESTLKRLIGGGERESHLWMFVCVLLSDLKVALVYGLRFQSRWNLKLIFASVFFSQS